MTIAGTEQYIREVKLRRDRVPSFDQYPFSLPVVQTLSTLPLHPAVLDEEPALAPPVIDSYGGRSLHEQSHGESFFAVMMNRFGGHGFYVLDEPEAALSPTRQLAMIARLAAAR